MLTETWFRALKGLTEAILDMLDMSDIHHAPQ